jgi:4-amino-4-deoxy-L-arabinose transferase-like glycosyltransferase
MSDFLKKQGLLLAIVIAALYFPIFWKATLQPLTIWDEARVGVNALEIRDFKTSVVPHYEGKPDMFSLKPPLVPILERIAMGFVGYNVLGVRLPSLVAIIGICALFIGFCYRRYGSIWPGIIAALALCTAPGFMRDHAARTGDYDAVLTLFMTAYCLTYFQYLENSRQKKYLYLAAAALVFAILTKGIAALIPLPGLLIYTLIAKKAKYVFSRRHFYLLAATGIVTVGAFYGIREYYSPGYLSVVVQGEIMTVPTEPIGGHSEPWWFYFKSTLSEGFTYLSLFALIGFIAGFRGRFRDSLIPYLFAYSASYFLVITLSATKTSWYDVPLYPAIALAAGVFIYKMIAIVTRQSKYENAVFMLSTLLLFTYPYVEILRRHANVPPVTWDLMKYGDYMEKLKLEQPNIPAYTVLGKSYNPHSLFYAEAYTKSGFKTPHKNVREILSPGELVLCCERAAIEEMKARYDISIIDSEDPCVLVRIVSDKQAKH